MKLDVDQIRARYDEIVDQIARLQQEADELATALRVLDRFAEKPIDPDAPAGDSGLVPRPAGTPTTFQMVDMILQGAEQEGRKDGLTSRELMDGIRARYWPGVKNAQILPSIFGFAKNDRLIRDGDKWRRKK